MKFMVGKRIITDHVSDMTGVIVLTSSICVCVLPLSRADRHTDLNFGLAVRLKDI